MRKEIKVFVLVLLALRVILWLTGCSYKDEEKSNVDVYETLEEMEDEFVVFYDSSAYMLLQSFQDNHPNIEIEMILIDQFTEDLKEMIDRYGPPDLVLGRIRQLGKDNFIDLCDLPYCYEKGYIADLSVFTANDADLDINAYFPGTFDVFREKDHLYAIPLGISMDFMVTSESKYKSSDFAALEEGYTGRELLDVWLSEISKEREEGEFFCSEIFSDTNLLYQLGAISHTETGIHVDEEIFKRVYEYSYAIDKQRENSEDFWFTSGKLFNVDTGYVGHTAFEPRKYEGKFTVSHWAEMDAPGLVLSYATTANQYHLDEGTKAIYFPNMDDGNAYAAKVAVYGAVGAESRRQELAYELLRLLMDEKISYFQNLSGNHFGRVTSDPKNMGLNFYPVNKEAAYDFLDEFEQRNSVLFYEQLGSGRFLQMLNRVDVSAEEKTKHENMLKGITGMYCWNEQMSTISTIISDYQSMEITDYAACYAEVVDFLNSDMTMDEEMAEIDDEALIDSEEEISVEELVEQRNETSDVKELREKIKDVEVGDTFFFGETEQDNILENGAEPIEWIVLEKTEDKAFVISKKVLEWLTFSKYDDEMYDDDNAYTWDIERNQQRIWLTNELYTNGFSENEKEIILLTHNAADELHLGEYVDYLYVPSQEEVEEYMLDVQMRKAEMTAYVAEKAGMKEGDYIRWSLRTVATSWKSTMQINEKGEFGSWYCNSPNGVRPVMWLDIK